MAAGNDRALYIVRTGDDHQGFHKGAVAFTDRALADALAGKIKLLIDMNNSLYDSGLHDNIEPRWIHKGTGVEMMVFADYVHVETVGFVS